MCSLERHGTVYVLTLLGNDEHWLSESRLTSILQIIGQVHDSRDATAFVTTNEGKFFSNGLDLPWLNENEVLKEQRSRLLLHLLDQVALALMKLNVPSIACICGHAVAAGLFLAMAHDHRVMRSDRGFLYNSAVNIGFIIPRPSLVLLKSKMTPKHFKDCVLKGVKYTAIMALEAGLVDTAHRTSEETFSAALMEASSYAFARETYAVLREAMYADVIRELEVA